MNKKLNLLVISIVGYSTFLYPDSTWIGTTNNDMTLSSNWTSNTVPDANTVANFDSSYPQVNLIPSDNSTNFSALSFNFIYQASGFIFGFTDQSLTFTGSGITGNQTDATFNLTHTGSLSSFHQISFSNSNSMVSTLGNSIINATYTGTTTNAGNINDIAQVLFDGSGGLAGGVGSSIVRIDGTASLNAYITGGTISNNGSNNFANDIAQILFDGSGGYASTTSGTGSSTVSISGEASLHATNSAGNLENHYRSNLNDLAQILFDGSGGISKIASGTGSSIVSINGSASILAENLNGSSIRNGNNPFNNSAFVVNDLAQILFDGSGGYSNNAAGTGQSVVNIGNSANLTAINSDSTMTNGKNSSNIAQILFDGGNGISNSDYGSGSSVVTIKDSASLNATNSNGTISNQWFNNDVAQVLFTGGGAGGGSTTKSEVTIRDQAVINATNSNSSQIFNSHYGNDVAQILFDSSAGYAGATSSSNTPLSIVNITGAAALNATNSAGSQLYNTSSFNNNGNDVAQILFDGSGGTETYAPGVGNSLININQNASLTALNQGSIYNSAASAHNLGQIIFDGSAGANLSMNGSTGQCLVNISDNVVISASNSGSLANTGTLSGAIAQILFDGSDTTGSTGNCVATFNRGTLSAINTSTGTVNGDQIAFYNTNLVGDPTIKASNQDGSVTGHGIAFYGPKMTATTPNIILENSSLWIDASVTSPFSIGSLTGDATSTVPLVQTLKIMTQAGNNTTFNGIISDNSGTHDVIITGSGTQKLTGANTFGGSTTINEGTLILTGSLAGNVNIDVNGTLKGTGFVAGNVVNGGTIAPGESIGTIHFLSNYTNNGGNYNVEVSGTGASDLIEVTGNAILNGGFVVASSTDGTYKFQNTYTIVETTGTRSGFYTGAVATSSMVQPVVTYDNQHVYLTLLANIQNAAKTSNQLTISTLLDGIINPNAEQNLLLSEIVGLSNDEARKALNSLSGYQHAADLVTAQLINRQFIRRLFDPIRSIVTTEPNCCRDLSENCNRGLSSWFDAGGTFLNVKGSYETPELNSYGYNLTLGTQATVHQSITLGVAGSYEHDNLKFNHSNGTEESNTWLAGLYVLYRPSSFYGLVDFVYGNSSNHLKRSIHIGSLHYHANSNPDMCQLSFYGEGGFDINVCKTLLQPFVGIEIGDYRRKHVNESFANGWGLEVKKRDHAFTTTRLGFHLTSNDFIKCGTNLSLDLAWNYLASNNKNKVNERFEQFGTPFTIKWTKFNHNSIDYALTYRMPIRDNFQWYIEGSGESCKKANIFTALAGLQYSW